MRIAPKTRLLFWFGLVAVPFSMAGALHPDAAPVAIALILALLLAALLDAALSHALLDQVAVTLPEILRLSKEREGHFDVFVNNPTLGPLRVRLGVTRCS